jgi:hypothetical protein
VSEASFEQAIFDHLALAERNRKLERSMPIDRYRDVYGGGSSGRVGRDQPAEPDTSALDRAFQWDATNERPLPTFDDWDSG